MTLTEFQRTVRIPLLIILAGALTAVSVYSFNTSGADQASITRTRDAHVYGDARAPVRIVEFSDFECPYCADLHPTLKRLIDESDGVVAWEFRHLPLKNHANAEDAAYAAECVAMLGTDDAFFSYAEKLFQNQHSLTEELYVSLLDGTGISKDDFTQCLKDERVHMRVAEDLDAALQNGAGGTPFSIVIYEDGTTRPVSGALSYTEWKRIISK